LDIHRRMVTGCDDDYCEPGVLRPTDWNVTFGTPRCRGAEGGHPNQTAFEGFCAAIAGEFRQHDRIIQALAAHYHIGAMHPFGDGNGRTSRALEAFMLRQAGVSGLVMVSLSNYYYENKEGYLAAMWESRRKGHDLTPFLKFALPAVSARCNAVAASITDHNKRTLFRQFAQSLFGKLRSPRRRVLADRQLRILESLLDAPTLDVTDLFRRTAVEYVNLKYPRRAWARDIINLLDVDAIHMDENGTITLNLDWPQQLSESALLDRYENLPSAVSANHPAMPALSRLLNRRR
ncbi:MAG: Fic family protein, partial [Candidatus Tectomicrobia bacterium]|nr:Fic family protein [Candidatus Tectomicrobia bacterium]